MLQLVSKESMWRYFKVLFERLSKSDEFNAILLLVDNPISMHTSLPSNTHFWQHSVDKPHYVGQVCIIHKSIYRLRWSFVVLQHIFTTLQGTILNNNAYKSHGWNFGTPRIFIYLWTLCLSKLNVEEIRRPSSIKDCIQQIWMKYDENCKIRMPW